MQIFGPEAIMGSCPKRYPSPFDTASEVGGLRTRCSPLDRREARTNCGHMDTAQVGTRSMECAAGFVIHTFLSLHDLTCLTVFVVSPDSEPTTEDSDLFVILQYKKPEAHTCAYALLTIEDVDGWASAFRERCCSADVSHDGGVRALGEHMEHHGTCFGPP